MSSGNMNLLDSRSVSIRRGLRLGRTPGGYHFVLGTSPTGGRGRNAPGRTPVVGRRVGVLSFLDAFGNRSSQSRGGQSEDDGGEKSLGEHTEKCSKVEIGNRESGAKERELQTKRMLQNKGDGPEEHLEDCII